MKNKIEDLRNHLFETLEALKDKDNPMDVDRANAISSVAGQIISSAKVEVDMMKIVGGTGTGFIASQPGTLPGQEPSNVKRIKAT